MNGLRPETSANSAFAYVTLFIGEGYLPGAIALVRSIRRTGTDADIVVMYKDDLNPEALEPLRELGARLIAIDAVEVSEAFRERHQRAQVHSTAPFNKGEKPKFHTPFDNFGKLRLWQLEEYERCVFVDADALMLRNCDKLFQYPEFSAAPNVYESVRDFHRLNSGVFVASPSEATYKNMLDRLDEPEKFWRRTDQTFLQTYYPDWHGLPVYYNMLQYIWFNMPDLWHWQSIKIIHYQYEKPWQEDNPRATQLRPLIDLWQAYYEGTGIPDTDDLRDPWD